MNTEQRNLGSIVALETTSLTETYTVGQNDVEHISPVYGFNEPQGYVAIHSEGRLDFIPLNAVKSVQMQFPADQIPQLIEDFKNQPDPREVMAQGFGGGFNMEDMLSDLTEEGCACGDPNCYGEVPSDGEVN